MTANKTIAAAAAAAFASLASACTGHISLGSESVDAGGGESADGGETSSSALAYVCATSCTGTCVSGRCLTEIVAGSDPISIAVDATNVYWLTESAVMKAPLGGGAPTTLASGQNIVRNITRQMAIDANNVYWLSGDGNVLRVPIDGGATTTIWSADSETTAFPGIAVDATSVYWTLFGSTNVGVMKAPTAGGTPVTLATVPAAVAAGSITAFAIDETSAYWIAVGDPRVSKVPLGGGTVMTYSGSHPSLEYAVDLVAHGSNLYWINFGGALGQLPIAGGTPTTLVSGLGISVIAPGSIAVDSTSVYWTTNSAAMRATDPEGGLESVPNSLVMKIARSGGAPVTLDTTVLGDDHQGAITVDATSVYWGTSHGIMKLTPK